MSVSVLGRTHTHPTGEIKHRGTISQEAFRRGKEQQTPMEEAGTQPFSSNLFFMLPLLVSLASSLCKT